MRDFAVERTFLAAAALRQFRALSGRSANPESGLDFLNELAGAGVNHVILNLKYGRRAAGEVLEEIGREVLPRLGQRGRTPPLEAAAQARVSKDRVEGCPA